MDALSGEGTSGTQQTAFDAADMFMSTMMDQGAFWRSRDPVDVNGVTYGAGSDAIRLPSRKPQHPAFKAIDKSPLPPIYEPRWRAWTTGFGGVWKLNGEAGIGSASSDPRYRRWRRRSRLPIHPRHSARLRRRRQQLEFLGAATASPAVTSKPDISADMG